MKIACKKAIKIPDGKHIGVVTNISYRSRPYDYVDIIIEFPVEESKIKIKAGYPALITENSRLGQLLKRFGEEIIEGIGIDPDEILIGKKVKFVTETETNSKGTFAKVKLDSIDPVEHNKQQMIDIQDE